MNIGTRDIVCLVRDLEICTTERGLLSRWFIQSSHAYSCSFYGSHPKCPSVSPRNTGVFRYSTAPGMYCAV